MEKDTNNRWQVCPLCNGSGVLAAFISYMGIRLWEETETIKKGETNCPTCNGSRIISTVTGKPPVSEQAPEKEMD